MTKNSKKTESEQDKIPKHRHDNYFEDSENDTNSFDIIKTGLATYWEKRQTKKQLQKQSEADKRIKRVIAAKKAAQTRKRRNAAGLRSELAVLKTERKGVLRTLTFIQKDLDEKLDELGKQDDQQIDPTYVESQLEKSNFLEKFLQDKTDFYMKEKIGDIFAKYFRISLKQLMGEDEVILFQLQVERIFHQIQRLILDDDIKEVKSALKKLNIKPEQKTEAQLKWESQVGKCKSTEVALKKLLMNYFKDKLWYNERLNTNGRKHIETDSKRQRLGIAERAKNNDVTAIGDFGFNDFLAVFGHDVQNNKQEYNKDLVLEVFELDDSTTITGSARIFNMIQQIKGFENDLKHKDGKPLSDSTEEILYNHCDFIQSRIEKYLKK